jgi:hypothetical protein
MAGDEGRYLLPPFAHRQFRRVLDPGHLLPPALENDTGCLDGLPQPRQPLVQGQALLLAMTQAPQTPAQARAVKQKTGIQVGRGWEGWASHGAVGAGRRGSCVVKARHGRYNTSGSSSGPIEISIGSKTKMAAGPSNSRRFMSCPTSIKYYINNNLK